MSSSKQIKIGKVYRSKSKILGKVGERCKVLSRCVGEHKGEFLVSVLSTESVVESDGHFHCPVKLEDLN